jgi:hypothetical protein
MRPLNLRPIRLSGRSEPVDSDQFIYELKIDGFRALAYIEAGNCELVSRNEKRFEALRILPRGLLNIFVWKAPFSTERLRASMMVADQCSEICFSADVSACSSHLTSFISTEKTCGRCRLSREKQC